jgi:hypothetical protein
MLGMTLYVHLLLANFFKREKYRNIVFEHPRIFALVFAVIIVFLSIRCGGSLWGGIKIEALPLILFMSTPVGIIEGYGLLNNKKDAESRNPIKRPHIHLRHFS